MGSATNKFPPVVVFKTDDAFILVDGFHRVAAAHKRKFADILAEIHEGTMDDALTFALAQNQAHGLRRTNADKRHAAELALKRWPQSSDREIARKCGVSDPFIGEVRKQMLTISTWTRTGADGKKYPPSKPNRNVPPPQKGDEVFITADRASMPPPKKAKVQRPADETGLFIPNELLPLWNRRPEAQEVLSALSTARTTLQKAREKKDPLFSRVSFNSALAHIDQAYADVTCAKLTTVCPVCGGNPEVIMGCTLCKGIGLLSAFHWKNLVSEELKGLRKTAVEKQSKPEGTR
jgi:hypothetical protein